jgi:hypothetical protein
MRKLDDESWKFIEYDLWDAVVMTFQALRYFANLLPAAFAKKIGALSIQGFLTKWHIIIIHPRALSPCNALGCI